MYTPSAAAKPAGPQPTQEIPPAPRRLREALGGANDLAAAVVVDADGYHDVDVLVGPPQLHFR